MGFFSTKQKIAIFTAFVPLAVIYGIKAGDMIWDITNQPDSSSESSSTSQVVIGEDISDKATFVRAKDGDTYVVKLESTGQEATIRLIGVDTPESVAPEEYEKENTAEGKKISEIVKSKLQKGDTLSVEYDVQKEDKYGRALAYLYFSDGKMVQDWLVESGYAQMMTIQPNSKYAEHFAELQHTAAENKVGLWAYYYE